MSTDQWNDIMGLLILLSGGASTFFTGKYINEEMHGEAAMLGYLLLAVWLIFTLVMSFRFFFYA